MRATLRGRSAAVQPRRPSGVPSPRVVVVPRAFVAGATGYTGRAVVEALRAQSIATVAHVRPDSSRKDEFRARFEALGAEVDHTPWEADAVAATVRRLEPTVIFGLLGTTRGRARTEGMGAVQAYARIDYGLTKWLIDAAVACEPRPRFVYLSAATVKQGTRNAYLAARLRCEDALRDTDLPWTIARPSIITGGDRDESRPLERIGAVVGDATLAVVGVLGGSKMRARYRSTDAATLGRGLVRVALDPAYAGRVVYSEELR